MLNLSKEALLILVDNNYDIIWVALFSIAITFSVSKAWRKITRDGEDIPGRLGLPFIGETFSFLSATNSTKGCYDFVRLRRVWLVLLFCFCQYVFQALIGSIL